MCSIFFPLKICENGVCLFLGQKSLFLQPCSLACFQTSYVHNFSPAYVPVSLPSLSLPPSLVRLPLCSEIKELAEEGEGGGGRKGKEEEEEEEG